MMFSDRISPDCEDTLGGRISWAREVKAISPEEAAQMLGVLLSSWNAWECDRDIPRANRLTMMAGLLGVSPSWLLTGLGSGPKEHATDNDVEHLQRAVCQISQDIEALNGRMRELALRLKSRATAPA